MSRSVGNSLPAALLPLLDGRDLASREGLTFLLLTPGEEGWPYVAMLSVGEVLAVGDRTVRLALWRESTSSHNLTRTGRATLMLIHEGSGFYLQLRARRGPDLAIGQARRAFFEATVEDVLEDVVWYAEITSGLSFRLKEREKILAGWRETVAAMRAAAFPVASP